MSAPRPDQRLDNEYAHIKLQNDVREFLKQYRVKIDDASLHMTSLTSNLWDDIHKNFSTTALNQRSGFGDDTIIPLDDDSKIFNIDYKASWAVEAWPVFIHKLLEPTKERFLIIIRYWNGWNQREINIAFWINEMPKIRRISIPLGTAFKQDAIEILTTFFVNNDESRIWRNREIIYKLASRDPFLELDWTGYERDWRLVLKEYFEMIYKHQSL
jgi:hypothetical protein